MPSTNIVSINDELYNYLNYVNYGMSKPQFNHLTTIANGLINYLNFFLEHNIKSKSVGFLIIDDTVNSKESSKKIQGLSYNHSHKEAKNTWSHCVVT